MESRNITLAGIWAFTIIWLVASFVVGADLLIALILFFIAVAASVGISSVSRGGQAAPKGNP